MRPPRQRHLPTLLLVSVLVACGPAEEDASNPAVRIEEPAPAVQVIPGPPSIVLGASVLFGGMENTLEIGDADNGWQVQSVEAEGATVTQMENAPYIVHVRPTQGIVRVTATLVHPQVEYPRTAERDFSVITVPAPTIQLRVPGSGGNQAPDYIGGIPPTSLVALEARAVADPGFQRTYPNEAQYWVTDWEVSLANGTQRKGDPIRASGTIANIGRFRNMARAGDRLVVQVRGVERRTSEGGVPVEFDFPIVSIPIR